MPERVANLYANYRLKELPMNFFVGLNHTGKIYTDNANQIRINGHTTVDAAVSYRPVSYTHLDVYKRQRLSRPGDPSMKITKLTTYIVPPRWCFLKIETDAGIVGWGEPVVEGRAHSVAAAVEELSDYLIGKDPRNIEDHWTVLYRGGFYRGGAIHMSALAGIDQALWDIKGKDLGVPVSQLLGGNVRDRIRVYSWIGGDRPADTAAAAKGAVERGFTAVKMNGTEELQYIDSFDKVEKCLENVAAVRDAVGPNVGIGVDFHGRVHKPMAKVLKMCIRDRSSCANARSSSSTRLRGT